MRENEMLEVKADALEASFEALEREDGEVARLREEMAQLKAGSTRRRWRRRGRR